MKLLQNGTKFAMNVNQNVNAVKNAISHMDVCEDCYYEQLGDEIEAKIKKAKQKLIKELTKSGYTKDEITEIINKRFDT